jgi:hypothetical protein
VILKGDFNRPTLLFNVVLPLLAALALLYSYQGKIRRASDIGLGMETSTFLPYEGSYPIHIDNLALANAMREGWVFRGRKRLALWFGNSQLHGINQFRPGQKNCIYYCYHALAKVDKTVLGVSYPNANLQEILLSILALSTGFPGANTLVIPIFFEDMREDGIRTEIATSASISKLRDSGETKYLQNIASLDELMKEGSGSKVEAGDFQAVDKTAQETSERYFDRLAQRNWTVWASRADLRANIFNELYMLRNRSFGIQPNSIRKMIAGPFAENYKALKQIVRYAKDKNIRLILYIPPLRTDISPPYDLQEYGRFKKDIEKEAENNNAFFLDLERLVPADSWGVKSSSTGNGNTEIDFMHFREKGHRLLADTIARNIMTTERDL